MPYDDLDITNDKIKRWHPLNQSLYVGYKVMLAGLLMISKGDRIAMNASVESRYPFLDDDVISFCAGIAPEYKLRGMTEKWILRQVAARSCPPQIANRPKTMFRAHMSGSFLGPQRPSWVDQLLSPESLRATGYFNPAAVALNVPGKRACHALHPLAGSLTWLLPVWSRRSSGTTFIVAAGFATCPPGRYRAAGMRSGPGI